MFYKFIGHFSFMAKLQVRHESSGYSIRFSPSTNADDEASATKPSFEECLEFVIEQLEERTILFPGMESLSLKVEGDLPLRQKYILAGIVGLYNRSPGLYNTLSDPNSFQSLAKYLGYVCTTKKNSGHMLKEGSSL